MSSNGTKPCWGFIKYFRGTLKFGGGGGMKEMVVVNNIVFYSILNQAIYLKV